MAFVYLAFFAFGHLSAQEISQSAGLRLSYGGLLTYKRGLNKTIYAEGILSLRWKGFEMIGLLEKQKAAFKSDHLYWFYGGGLHLGYHGRNNTIDFRPGSNDKLYINLGIDFIIGFEYDLKNLPINFSIDYKPAFYFTGDRVFAGEGLGLSVRYLIE